MNRKKIIIFVVIAISILCLVGFLIRQKFIIGGENNSDTELNQKYEEAMKADKYGGKTREETLILFTKALKSGDTELASKYFMLDPDSSLDKWVRTLALFKERGLLDKIVQDIENNSDSVELKLNEYSGVWKITNFK